MKTLLMILLLAGFASGARAQDWPGPTEHHQSAKKYFLYTGFTFDAVLRTAIFSYNAETPVIAATEFDVTFLGRTMIPKGTKFIGNSAIEKTDNRVNVVFHTMVFPDGEEIKFRGLALWPDGSAGIIGKVDKKKSVLPAKILLSAAQTAAEAGGDSVPNEMVKGLASDTQNELAQKQETSVSVPRDTGILIYISGRLEY